MIISNITKKSVCCRATEEKILTDWSENKSAKISKRDSVNAGDTEKIYMLWNTDLVSENLETGEVKINITGNDDVDIYYRQGRTKDVIMTQTTKNRLNLFLNYYGFDGLDRDASEILATICHELCHIYENAYIHIPRGGYHDRQWTELMESCGLTPVFLNKSKTAVSTKIAEGGAFEEFVKTFKEKHGEDYFNIVEYSKEIEHKTKVALGIEDGDDTEDGSPKADNADKPVKKYNRNKVKYTCPDCGAKVWGKPGLHIECSDCACSFEEEEHEYTDEN